MEMPVEYRSVPTDTLCHSESNTECAQPEISYQQICDKTRSRLCCWNFYFISVFLIMLLVLLVYLPVNTLKFKQQKLANANFNGVALCDIQLVETIPLGMRYSTNESKFLSTYEAWNQLLDNAKSSIDIASFYWLMRDDRSANLHNSSSAHLGEQIYQRLIANSQAERKLKIRITQNQTPTSDTALLEQYGAAVVVYPNFQKYFGSGGMLHTKLWIIDGRHFYLGSADMTWLSLNHRKELGVLALNCPELAKDLRKIFEIYWLLGNNDKAALTKNWPLKYATIFNLRNPMPVRISQNDTPQMYFSSSPPPLSAYGRTHDLDAILNAIDSSKSYVHIALMNYYPLVIFSPKPKFWPYIDNALRRAAVERNVAVKLLISLMQHSDAGEEYFLTSLHDMSKSMKNVDIQVRRFIVPEYDGETKIPFGRVNHNKYMVTDNVAYIGTSNWSGDFFTNTAGIGFLIKELSARNLTNTIRSDLDHIFSRDWNSPYAIEL